MLGMTLWASDMNLRLPDGIFLAYVPLLVQFEPSPSRLLCLLDPLLPFGFMMRCLSGKYDEKLIQSSCSSHILFTAYAGQPDMLPTHSGTRNTQADGRVKEIVEQINLASSEESTEPRIKHNTVMGK
jgi:hormone-sensitive lipase